MSHSKYIKKKSDRVSKSRVRCVVQIFGRVLRSEACASHFSQIDIAAVSHLFTLHLSLILKGPQTLQLNMETSQKNERMGNASAPMMHLCVTQGMTARRTERMWSTTQHCFPTISSNIMRISPIR